MGIVHNFELKYVPLGYRVESEMMGGNFRNPKCGEMASPIQYGVEEVDDAALWAIVDSAAASHSATKARKQQQQLTVNHHRSPIVSSSRIIQYQPKSEVVQQPWNRPQKMARRCSLEMSESSPLPLVQQRSPEPYLSPQIGKSDLSNNSPEPMIHSLSGRFPSVSLFKDYQNAAMAILEKTDFTMISGNPFIKKSGWRKISFYFNLSYEIKDKTIEFDDNRNVQRAEFVVRAHMQGGRFSDGWGSCERREKRFLKPNHDIPSTAETRAKNKACQDLLGIGEYRPGAGHLQRQN